MQETRDKSGLDIAIEMLKQRLADGSTVPTRDLCDIAKVLLAAEKTEAEMLARILGNRRAGMGGPLAGRVSELLNRIEAEEPPNALLVEAEDDN